MGTRKVWTSKEDNVLRFLKEQRGEIQWSAIARIMQQQFSICGKTGKQCRQRYHNHLKASISNANWSEEEDKDLLLLHEEYGNKWSMIAQNIEGRSENCVKNHFYSKLRKIVRRLNHLYTGISKSPTSIIPQALLSKIISVSEARFKLGSKISEEWINFSMDLIIRLYNFDGTYRQYDEVREETRETEMDLIKDFVIFEQNFKKKRLSRNDLNEGDYRQRANKSYKRKQRGQQRQLNTNEGKKIEDLAKEEKFILKKEKSNVKIGNEGFDPCSSVAKAAIPQDILEHSEEILENVFSFLKEKINTFDSFCELDKEPDWQAQIHMLDESGQCAYQYVEICHQ